MKKPTSYAKNNPNLRQPKMQHIRHVKPEFFVHDEVNNMSIEARLAEIGVWTCADKHGRFEWNPRSLRRLILPYEDGVEFESLMNEWVQHGFAEKYEVDGKTYGRILNWDKHQGIGTREKQSPAEYPAPTHADICQHGASTASAQCSACAVSEGKGKGQGEVKYEKESGGKGVGSAPEPGGVPSRKASEPALAKPKGKNRNPLAPSEFDLTELNSDLTKGKKQAGIAGKENPPASLGDGESCEGGDAKHPPKVGDIPTNSLEQTLTVLSDSEFQTGTLREYSGDRDVFEAACKDAIHKFRDRDLNDRSVLARVLDDVMDTLKQRDIKYPPGFLKAKKTLDRGGPIQMSLPKKHRVLFGDVFGGNSVLSLGEWREDLRPYREQLQTVATFHGVPTTFEAGIEFLDRFMEWIVNESGESEWPEDLVQEVKGKMRRHVESETDKAMSRRALT